MRSIDLSIPSIPSLSQKNLSPLDYNAKGLQRSSTKTGGPLCIYKEGVRRGRGGVRYPFNPSLDDNFVANIYFFLFFFPSIEAPLNRSPLLWLQRASRLRKEGKKRGGGRKEGRRVEWITRALIARGRTVGGRGRGEASSWGVCSFVVEDVWGIEAEIDQFSSVSPPSPLFFSLPRLLNGGNNDNRHGSNG